MSFSKSTLLQQLNDNKVHVRIVISESGNITIRTPAGWEYEIIKELGSDIFFVEHYIPNTPTVYKLAYSRYYSIDHIGEIWSELLG